MSKFIDSIALNLLDLLSEHWYYFLRYIQGSDWTSFQIIYSTKHLFITIEMSLEILRPPRKSLQCLSGKKSIFYKSEIRLTYKNNYSLDLLVNKWIELFKTSNSFNFYIYQIRLNNFDFGSSCLSANIYLLKVLNRYVVLVPL